MSTKKKLVLLWHNAGGFLEVHKVKDPLLFPLYLSREYTIPYEIVSLNSENKTVREPLPGGGTLLRLANKHGLGKHFTLKQVAGWLPHLILYISYLVKNRKSISHIMLFHWHYMTQLLMFLCRILCPTVKVYLKLDMSAQKASEKLTCIHNAKKPHDRFLNHCMSLPHLTSIECRNAFDVLKADPIFGKRNIACIPPTGLSGGHLALCTSKSGFSRWADLAQSKRTPRYCWPLVPPWS